MGNGLDGIAKGKQKERKYFRVGSYEAMVIVYYCGAIRPVFIMALHINKKINMVVFINGYGDEDEIKIDEINHKFVYTKFSNIVMNNITYNYDDDDSSEEKELRGAIKNKDITFF